MSDRMHIMHVVLSLDVGGLERNVVNQVREGRRLGQEVSILCVETPGTLADRARGLGAKVTCVNKRPGLRPGIIRQIRAVLREHQPTVVHTHQVGPLFYAGMASVGLGIPLIVHTEHGKEDYASRRRTRILGRIGGRFTRVFYCLTQDMADAVAAAGVVPREKIRVIMNGIDVPFYQQPRDTRALRQSLGIPNDAPLIGTVGRLSEIKRQDVLINAFAGAHQRHPRAHLMLVGDGPLLDDLRRQAESLGVADRVHFAGYQGDTTPYLHAMDVFALTSRSEGMPQALLEACVAEKPVIASRVGGIPEVIEDGIAGLLVEPGNVHALGAGLCELLSNRNRAAEFARRASQRVAAMFDVARMASDYQRDFNELLSTGALAPCRGSIACQVQ